LLSGIRRGPSEVRRFWRIHRRPQSFGQWGAGDRSIRRRHSFDGSLCQGARRAVLDHRPHGGDPSQPDCVA
jgi:hypothetical protein